MEALLFGLKGILPNAQRQEVISANDCWFKVSVKVWHTCDSTVVSLSPY